MKSPVRMARHCAIPVVTAGVSWVLILLFAAAAHSQEETESPPLVEIPGTQLLRMTSSSMAGQEYVLQVHLPRGYSDTNRTFPAVYVLDGQWDFALVNSLYGQQFYDGFLPGLIIVGITWGGTSPNIDSLRARDFTPTQIDQLPQSGGAARFLSFLKQELVPFIETKFHASTNDRTLMGSSFGGLFTLFAMFHDTELFNRYIAVSPALAWDRQAIAQHEKAYAEKTSRLPVRLFMALGEYEDVPGFEQFVDRLETRNYDGLEMQTRVLENTGHSGSKAEGFSRGLQHVFARPSLTIDSTVLNLYRGVYQVNPQFRVRVFTDQGRLMGQGPDGSISVLHAESEKDFYVKGQYLFVHFQRDDAGNISGFEVELFSGTQIARKVE